MHTCIHTRTSAALVQRSARGLVTGCLHLGCLMPRSPDTRTRTGSRHKRSADGSRMISSLHAYRARLTDNGWKRHRDRARGQLLMSQPRVARRLRDKTSWRMLAVAPASDPVLSSLAPAPAHTSSPMTTRSPTPAPAHTSNPMTAPPHTQAPAPGLHLTSAPNSVPPAIPAIPKFWGGFASEELSL